MIDLSVLYVEDSQMARSVVGEFLGEIVKELDVAVDGEEALKKFKEKEFDVIVTDLRMPNMDGFSFLREVRELDEKVKIVVVSAFRGEQEVEECKKLAVFEFLKKPLNLDELETILERLHVKIGTQKW